MNRANADGRHPHHANTWPIDAPFPLDALHPTTLCLSASARGSTVLSPPPEVDASGSESQVIGQPNGGGGDNEKPRLVEHRTPSGGVTSSSGNDTSSATPNARASRLFRERRKERERILRETVAELAERNATLEDLLLHHGIVPPAVATLRHDLSIHRSQRLGGPPIHIPGVTRMRPPVVSSAVESGSHHDTTPLPGEPPHETGPARTQATSVSFGGIQPYSLGTHQNDIHSFIPDFNWEQSRQSLPCSVGIGPGSFSQLMNRQTKICHPSGTAQTSIQRAAEQFCGRSLANSGASLVHGQQPEARDLHLTPWHPSRRFDLPTSPHVQPQGQPYQADRSPLTPLVGDNVFTHSRTPSDSVLLANPPALTPAERRVFASGAGCLPANLLPASLGQPDQASVAQGAVAQQESLHECTPFLGIDDTRRQMQQFASHATVHPVSESHEPMLEGRASPERTASWDHPQHLESIASDLAGRTSSAIGSHPFSPSTLSTTSWPRAATQGDTLSASSLTSSMQPPDRRQVPPCYSFSPSFSTSARQEHPSSGSSQSQPDDSTRPYMEYCPLEEADVHTPTTDSAPNSGDVSPAQHPDQLMEGGKEVARSLGRSKGRALPVQNTASHVAQTQ